MSTDDRLAIYEWSSGATRYVENSAGCSQPSWAPDGRSLVLECEGDIVLVDVSGGTRRNLSDRMSSGTKDTLDYPTWSPRGDMIAFVNLFDFPSGSASDGVYMMDANCVQTGSNCVATAKGPIGPALTDWVVWSPNGEYVTVHHSAQIGLLSTKGGLNGGVLELSEPYSFQEATTIAWAPDSEQIAYTREDGIYLVEADGTNPRLLTELSEWVELIAWVSVP